MKSDNSSECTEITPTKKKLTQARLPFKLLSDVSPTPTTPQTRKRKLSAPEEQSATKIGKIHDENGSVECLVVISDDDSRDVTESQKEEKHNAKLNPFVKLVDTAWKKKLHKSKKRKNSKKQNQCNGSKDSVTELNDSNCKTDVEMMEVDLPDQEEIVKCNEDRQSELDDKESKEKEKKIVNNTEDVIQNKEKEQQTSESKTNKLDETTISQDDEINEQIENKTTSSENTSKTRKSKNKEINSPQSTGTAVKRSMRNKIKSEDKNVLNSSSSSSKLDDSIVSNPVTPKQSRSSSVTNSAGNDSMNDSTASVNLTPKQLQKKLEAAKKKEEREKERQERELKKQQEKEERAKQKLEKEEQRKKEREEKEEAKRKEREEKEEQRKKEKEEKERQRELERKMKEEKEEQKRKEREEKEEQKKKEKEAKEEEKRKKQEALEQEKLEQENKKKKAAEAFVNFFVPKQKTDKIQATIGMASKNSVLSSFAIKSDMRLAPTTRVDLNDDQLKDLDNLLQEQVTPKDDLYLKDLKAGKKPLSSGKTWPLCDKDDDDDVMIIEDELPPIEGSSEVITCDTGVREKLRPKLLSFHENRRPPYWGTWRKKSIAIKPRRPFGQDEKQLDYEVDSDDEWEEEQDGESIDGSAAGSDDEAGNDEYEVDNEVFVPHGYLSDEEATMDDEDNNMLSLSPEAQKQRLKHLEDEFECELKKPTEKLKPRVYGLIWESKDGGKPDKCVDALWSYFGKFSMILKDPSPYMQPAQHTEETEKKKIKKKKSKPDGEQASPKSEKKKKVNSEAKEKKVKAETKKAVNDLKKNQPGINSFLKKIKPT